MAEFLDIDDPLWDTDALRNLKPGESLEGFHRAPRPITYEKRVGDSCPSHIQEIHNWTSDPCRAGKVFIRCNPSRVITRRVQRFHIIKSWYYFTEENVAFEFCMVWA